MDANDKRYTYDRFGMQGKRAGQAVYDIITQDNPVYTVEDVLDGYSKKYAQEIEDCIEANRKRYQSPFYIFVLSAKEMWATNLVRNWFIARQSKPNGSDMMVEYPNHTKTLYRIKDDEGLIELVWTLPGIEDCKSIIKNPAPYDPELVRCVNACFSGDLDERAMTVPRACVR